MAKLLRSSRAHPRKRLIQPEPQANRTSTQSKAVSHITKPALMRLCLFFALPILGTLSIRAETFLGIEKSRITQIRDLGYNQDPAFQSEIEKLRAEHEGSPVPELMYSTNLYWKQHYSGGDKVLLDAFEDSIEESIEIAEDYLSDHKNDTDARYTLAACQLLRVKYFVDHGRMFSAFWHQRKPMKAIAKILKKNPDYHDAKLMTGMANCFLSNAPGFLKTLARLMRYDADMDRGLRQLNETKDHGLFAKVDASYYLALVHSSQRNDKDACIQEFVWLTENYKCNIFYQVELAELENNSQKHQEANQRIENLLVATPNMTPPIMKMRAFSVLSWSSLSASRFDRAVQGTEQAFAYIETQPQFVDWKPWLLVCRADALNAMGRKEEALESLKLVPKKQANAYKRAQDKIKMLSD